MHNIFLVNMQIGENMFTTITIFANRDVFLDFFCGNPLIRFRIITSLEFREGKNMLIAYRHFFYYNNYAKYLFTLKIILP